MHKWPVLIVLLTGLVGCASPVANKPVANKSEYNLGVDSYRAKDYVAARSHWSVSVQAGEPLAVNNLGYLLYNGLGGPADISRAIELWTRNAKAGNSESAWHLGHAYEAGIGEPQSNEEAYAWYRCAVASAEAAPVNDKTEAEIANDARKSLNGILSKLSPEGVQASEALARQYIASYARRPGA